MKTNQRVSNERRNLVRRRRRCSIELRKRRSTMNVDEEKESSWNGREKHNLPSNGEFSSPRKRCRPSLSQRLGLTDDSDGSDDQPYSPSDEQFPSSNEQKIIRQPQVSLRESTLTATGQPSKAILDLLQDDDEEDEDQEQHHEEEAYSPSQLDPATMDEVSEQLKGMKKSSLTSMSMSIPVPSVTSYIPPVPSNPLSQEDQDYREKKKSNEVLPSSTCRLIPIHGECLNVIDPRYRIYSARLRAKVRQLVIDRLSSLDFVDRNEIIEELDHLVESPGRRLYWYRVICFLQNISLTNNSQKQIHSYLKELSRLLVLPPSLSKLLTIKQKYPKPIPIDSSPLILVDPRSSSSSSPSIHLKFLRYH